MKKSKGIQVEGKSPFAHVKFSGPIFASNMCGEDGGEESVDSQTTKSALMALGRSSQYRSLEVPDTVGKVRG
jgi:hypothetical protein